MSKYVEKEKKRRLLFFKYENSHLVLKSLIKNSNLPLNIREKAVFDLSTLPKDSSKVRLRNRCILSGRGRSILSSFSLSRLMLRKLVCDGFVPGLRKSSW